MTVFRGSILATLLVTMTTSGPALAESLDTSKLYTFLAAHRLPPITEFTPPYPIGGVRLDVTETRIDGAWLTKAGADGPILAVENLQNGMMAVSLLLPASVTGSPTWLWSIGTFFGPSIFGGTFFLGNLSGAGLAGDDQIGLSWITDSELLLTFFPAEWLGAPIAIHMVRLRAIR